MLGDNEKEEGTGSNSERSFYSTARPWDEGCRGRAGFTRKRVSSVFDIVCFDVGYFGR